MREIRFRGQRAETKEWVYGCLLIDEGRKDKYRYRIKPKESSQLYAFPVIQETIGQYTGLKDKNGKEIYEGDIIRFTDGIKINGSTIHQSAVKWVVELSGFYIHADCVGYYQVNPSQCEMYHYEIIGNIHTNSDILKEVSHEA